MWTHTIEYDLLGGVLSVFRVLGADAGRFLLDNRVGGAANRSGRVLNYMTTTFVVEAGPERSGFPDLIEEFLGN